MFTDGFFIEAYGLRRAAGSCRILSALRTEKLHDQDFRSQGRRTVNDKATDPVDQGRPFHQDLSCLSSGRVATDRKTGQESVAGQPSEDRLESARNCYKIERTAVKDVSTAPHRSEERRWSHDTERASWPRRNAGLGRRLLRRGRRRIESGYLV